MNMLGIVFTIGIVIAGGFLIWLYTKPGKRWLKNLSALKSFSMT